MKQKSIDKLYFFVDESGDPFFYDRKGNFIAGKEGCSQLLIIGFIKAEEPEVIRKKIINLQSEIARDEYLIQIPSLRKSLNYFHATDDSAEVREKVFKLIKELPFKSEFIVARKFENIFIKRHKKSPNIFYDDIVTKLFQNQLHKSKENIIYYATRGNRARQKPFEEAIRSGVLVFEEKWKIKVGSEIKIFPQRPVGEPCLQVADYMLWAVQRAFIKGEMRYYNFLQDKVSLIADIYDFDKYPNNYYNKRNPFDLKKISPLRLVPT